MCGCEGGRSNSFCRCLNIRTTYNSSAALEGAELRWRGSGAANAKSCLWAACGMQDTFCSVMNGDVGDMFQAAALLPQPAELSQTLLTPAALEPAIPGSVGRCLIH